MTKAHRNINIAPWSSPSPPSWRRFRCSGTTSWAADLILLVTIYAISVGGVTVGYHRLLTHRAFATYKPVEYLYASSSPRSRWRAR